MTPQEFEYIRRAVTALEDPDMSEMSRLKVLRVMEQICGKNATDLEMNLIGAVDAKISRRVCRNSKRPMTIRSSATR